MKACRWCKLEWLRIIISVLFFSSLFFLLIMTIIDFRSARFWSCSAFALGLVFLNRKMKRYCDRLCLKRNCQCGCHVIRECSGKCHHWCKYKTNVDMEVVLDAEGEEDVSEGCSDCKWSHELFDDSESSSNLLQMCNCSCHRFGVRTKRKSWRCRCHRWCYSKIKK